MRILEKKNGSARAASVRSRQKARPVLITGGSGFIGTNLAHRLLSHGKHVLLLDNFSRAGVSQNFRWLRETHGNLLQIEIADVQDADVLARAIKRASHVFHLAAQVAVTSSLENPVHDFEVNARGTLNVLEALRSLPHPPPLIYTSTNKVYGELSAVKLRAKGLRYEPVDEQLCRYGFSESEALDSRSPYGCSKGAASQYVIDYARTYSMPAVVFRMSCVYGPHQFGNEDQGWVAHFLIQAIEGKPITLYGDGKQVRDLLYVDDLVDALRLVQEKASSLAGQTFNVGGGPGNTVSLLELVHLLRELPGMRPDLRFEEWRLGDQRYYVSDTRKLEKAIGWKPKIGVRQGLGKLCEWLLDSRKRRQGLSRIGPWLKEEERHNRTGNALLLSSAMDSVEIDAV